MKIITCFFLLTFGICFTQNDSLEGKLEFSGYMESYYAFDLAQNKDNSIAPFLYNFDRHNQFGINLTFIKASYFKNNIRANLAFMAGTYVTSNLKNEPAGIKNIFEANLGVKLAKKRNLWFDIGIFPSHIGFESAIGKDCPNLTRSLLAENSPYYESGAKFSYISKNDKLSFSALVLNGWQTINIPTENAKLAFGHQLNYKANKKLELNSSSFIGSIPVENKNYTRLFHNFYSKIKPNDKIEIITGFDLGAQETKEIPTSFKTYYSPVLIGKFNFKENNSIALRIEHYSDLHGFTISATDGLRLTLNSCSINYDLSVNNLFLWRLEARNFYSNKSIFTFKAENVQLKYVFTTSFSIFF